MTACAVCRAPITHLYYRVLSNEVCPACVEKERAKDLATRTMYFWRGLLFAVGAAILGWLGLWGVIEISSFGGSSSVLSAGSFFRGAALIIVGRCIGGAAMKGARKRGGLALQISVATLTYLAYTMAVVAVLVDRLPVAKHTLPRILAAVLVGPFLPFIVLVKNPLSIISLITIGIACMYTASMAKRLELVSGPFNSTTPMAEKEMFKSLT